MGDSELLVVLDPQVETEGLIAEACELAGERTIVTAVAVVEVPPTLPLDAPLGAAERTARSLIRRAETAGAARGRHVEGRLLRTRNARAAIRRLAP
jgi:hypothetical protein